MHISHSVQDAVFQNESYLGTLHVKHLHEKDAELEREIHFATAQAYLFAHVLGLKRASTHVDLSLVRHRCYSA